MNGLISRDFALDPQDLARLLVSRANAGDVEGMVALYEPDAALACGDGRIAVGTDAIRKFYTDLLAAGRTFDLGEQRPAMLRENVALTSTRLPNGIVTAEVAREQIRRHLAVGDRSALDHCLTARILAPACARPLPCQRALFKIFAHAKLLLLIKRFWSILPLLPF